MLPALFQILLWIFRSLLFVGLLGLAIKNSELMVLRFFFAQEWTAPVSLVVLIVFTLGVVVGVAAAISFSRRRQRSAPIAKGQGQHGN
ncbi:MAG: LapA family protein [Rugosibacter sp.]|jgi:uncharacterized integral membrane protein|nr:lipopolysaccharide assembly protein A [Rugosibacter sp.]